MIYIVQTGYTRRLIYFTPVADLISGRITNTDDSCFLTDILSLFGSPNNLRYRLLLHNRQLMRKSTHLNLNLNLNCWIFRR